MTIESFRHEHNIVQNDLNLYDDAYKGYQQPVPKQQNERLFNARSTDSAQQYLYVSEYVPADRSAPGVGANKLKEGGHAEGNEQLGNQNMGVAGSTKTLLERADEACKNLNLQPLDKNEEFNRLRTGQPKAELPPPGTSTATALIWDAHRTRGLNGVDRYDRFENLFLNSSDPVMANVALEAMAREVGTGAYPDLLPRLRQALTLKAIIDLDEAKGNKEKQQNALNRLAALEEHSLIVAPQAIAIGLGLAGTVDPRTQHLTQRRQSEGDAAKEYAQFLSPKNFEKFNPNQFENRRASLYKLEDLALDHLMRFGDPSHCNAYRDLKRLHVLKELTSTPGDPSNVQAGLQQLTRLNDSSFLPDGLIRTTPYELSQREALQQASEYKPILGKELTRLRVDALLRLSLSDFSAETLIKCRRNLAECVDTTDPSMRPIVQWYDANIALQTIAEKTAKHPPSDASLPADQRGLDPSTVKEIQEQCKSLSKMAAEHNQFALDALVKLSDGEFASQNGLPVSGAFSYLRGIDQTKPQIDAVTTAPSETNSVQLEAARTLAATLTQIRDSRPSTTQAESRTAKGNEQPAYLSCTQSEQLAYALLNARAKDNPNLSDAIGTALKNNLHGTPSNRDETTLGLLWALARKGQSAEPLVDLCVIGSPMILESRLSDLSTMAHDKNSAATKLLTAMAGGCGDLIHCDSLAASAGKSLSAAADASNRDEILAAMVDVYRNKGDAIRLLATMGDIASSCTIIPADVRKCLRDGIESASEGNRSYRSAWDGMQSIASLWNRADIVTISDHLSNDVVERLATVAPRIPKEMAELLLSYQKEKLSQGSSAEKLLAIKTFSALAISATPEDAKAIGAMVQSVASTMGADKANNQELLRGAEIALLRMLRASDSQTAEQAFKELRDEEHWAGSLFKDDKFKKAVIGYAIGQPENLDIHGEAMKLVYDAGFPRPLALLFKDLGVEGDDKKLIALANTIINNYGTDKVTGEDLVRRALSNMRILDVMPDETRKQLTGSNSKFGRWGFDAFVKNLAEGKLNRDDKCTQAIFSNLPAWIEAQNLALGAQQKSIEDKLGRQSKFLEQMLSQLGEHTVKERAGFLKRASDLIIRTKFEEEANRGQHIYLVPIREKLKEHQTGKLEESHKLIQELKSKQERNQLALSVAMHMELAQTDCRAADRYLVEALLPSYGSQRLKECVPQLVEKEAPAALDRLKWNGLGSSARMPDYSSRAEALDNLVSTKHYAKGGERYSDSSLRVEEALAVIDREQRAKMSKDFHQQIDDLNFLLPVLHSLVIAGMQGQRSGEYVELTRELATKLDHQLKISDKDKRALKEYCAELQSYQKNLQEQGDKVPAELTAAIANRLKKSQELLDLFCGTGASDLGLLVKAARDSEFDETSLSNALKKDGPAIAAALVAAAAVTFFTAGLGTTGVVLGILGAPAAGAAASGLTKDIMYKYGVGNGSAMTQARNGVVKLNPVTGTLSEYNESQAIRDIWHEYRDEVVMNALSMGGAKILGTVVNTTGVTKLLPATSHTAPTLTGTIGHMAKDQLILHPVHEAISLAQSNPDKHNAREDPEKSLLSKLAAGDGEAWSHILFDSAFMSRHHITRIHKPNLSFMQKIAIPDLGSPKATAMQDHAGGTKSTGASYGDVPNLFDRPAIKRPLPIDQFKANGPKPIVTPDLVRPTDEPHSERKEKSTADITKDATQRTPLFDRATDQAGKRQHSTLGDHGEDPVVLKPGADLHQTNLQRMGTLDRIRGWFKSEMSVNEGDQQLIAKGKELRALADSPFDKPLDRVRLRAEILDLLKPEIEKLAKEHNIPADMIANCIRLGKLPDGTIGGLARDTGHVLLDLGQCTSSRPPRVLLAHEVGEHFVRHYERSHLRQANPQMFESVVLQECLRFVGSEVPRLNSSGQFDLRPGLPKQQADLLSQMITDFVAARGNFRADPGFNEVDSFVKRTIGDQNTSPEKRLAIEKLARMLGDGKSDTHDNLVKQIQAETEHYLMVSREACIPDGIIKAMDVQFAKTTPQTSNESLRQRMERNLRSIPTEVSGTRDGKIGDAFYQLFSMTEIFARIREHSEQHGWNSGQKLSPEAKTSLRELTDLKALNLELRLALDTRDPVHLARVAQRLAKLSLTFPELAQASQYLIPTGGARPEGRPRPSDIATQPEVSVKGKPNLQAARQPKSDRPSGESNEDALFPPPPTTNTAPNLKKEWSKTVADRNVEVTSEFVVKQGKGENVRVGYEVRYKVDGQEHLLTGRKFVQSVQDDVAIGDVKCHVMGSNNLAETQSVLIPKLFALQQEGKIAAFKTLHPGFGVDPNFSSGGFVKPAAEGQGAKLFTVYCKDAASAAEVQKILGKTLVENKLGFAKPLDTHNVGDKTCDPLSNRVTLERDHFDAGKAIFENKEVSGAVVDAKLAQSLLDYCKNAKANTSTWADTPLFDKVHGTRLSSEALSRFLAECQIDGRQCQLIYDASGHLIFTSADGTSGTSISMPNKFYLDESRAVTKPVFDAKTGTPTKLLNGRPAYYAMAEKVGHDPARSLASQPPDQRDASQTQATTKNLLAAKATEPRSSNTQDATNTLVAKAGLSQVRNMLEELVQDHHVDRNSAQNAADMVEWASKNGKVLSAPGAEMLARLKPELSANWNNLPANQILTLVEALNAKALTPSALERGLANPNHLRSLLKSTGNLNRPDLLNHLLEMPEYAAGLTCAAIAKVDVKLIDKIVSDIRTQQNPAASAGDHLKLASMPNSTAFHEQLMAVQNPALRNELMHEAATGKLDASKLGRLTTAMANSREMASIVDRVFSAEGADRMALAHALVEVKLPQEDQVALNKSLAGGLNTKALHVITEVNPQFRKTALDLLVKGKSVDIIKAIDAGTSAEVIGESLHRGLVDETAALRLIELSKSGHDHHAEYVRTVLKEQLAGQGTPMNPAEMMRLLNDSEAAFQSSLKVAAKFQSNPELAAAQRKANDHVQELAKHFDADQLKSINDFVRHQLPKMHELAKAARVTGIDALEKPNFDTNMRQLEWLADALHKSPSNPELVKLAQNWAQNYQGARLAVAAHMAGVRQHIQGDFVVLTHGTSRAQAKDLVDHNGSDLSKNHLSPKGIRGEFYATEDIRAGRAYATQQKYAGEGAVVGLAIPKTEYEAWIKDGSLVKGDSLYLDNREIKLTKQYLDQNQQPPFDLRIGQELIITAKGLSKLQGKGYFFTIEP